MARKKLRRRPAVQWATYLLVRFVATLLTSLPDPLWIPAGRLLGAVLLRLDRRHRGIALENMARTRIVRNPPALLAKLYRFIGISLLEILLVHRRIRRSTLSRHLRIHDRSLFDKAYSRGRGVIVAIGHLGNWEVAGHAMLLAGFPLQSLARPIENPYLERWVRRIRSSTGQRIISKYGALREMSEVLRKRGVLVIQVDQHAGRHGIPVPFFGRPASTVRSPALLSLRFGAPILPVEIYRDADGIHHVRMTEPIDPEAWKGSPRAVEEMTTRLNERIEGFVRAHPEQWNWLHRRWREEATIASPAPPDSLRPPSGSLSARVEFEGSGPPPAAPSGSPR